MREKMKILKKKVLRGMIICSVFCCLGMLSGCDRTDPFKHCINDYAGFYDYTFDTTDWIYMSRNAYADADVMYLLPSQDYTIYIVGIKDGTKITFNTNTYSGDVTYSIARAVIDTAESIIEDDVNKIISEYTNCDSVRSVYLDNYDVPISDEHFNATEEIRDAYSKWVLGSQKKKDFFHKYTEYGMKLTDIYTFIQEESVEYDINIDFYIEEDGKSMAIIEENQDEIYEAIREYVGDNVSINFK